MKRIYLDHGAGSPLRPAVWRAMRPWLKWGIGEPVSLYAEGRRAKAAMERAQTELGEFSGFKASEIYLIDSATSAMRILCEQVKKGMSATTDFRAAALATDHVSIFKAFESVGARVIKIGVDSAGIIKENDLREAIDLGVNLISIVAVNSETGVRQPLERIGKLIHDGKKRASDTVFHIDATQAAGHLVLSPGAWKCEAMTFSSTKLGGPKGAAALCCKGRLGFKRSIGGTVNVPAVVGFGEAARQSRRNLSGEVRRLARFKGLFLDKISKAKLKFKVNGDQEFASVHLLNLTFPGIDGERLLLELDRLGVAVSAASACVTNEPSRVLKVMGRSESEVVSSLRFSFGWSTTRQEIIWSTKLLEKAIDRLTR